MTSPIVVVAVLLPFVALVPCHARKWTDATGAYSVEAEVVDVIGESVRLRRDDGAVVTVPIDKLSDADRQYLRSLALPERGHEGGAAEARLMDARAIRQALTRPVQGDFTDAALFDIIEHLADLHAISVVVDAPAIRGTDQNAYVPLTVRIAERPLAEAIDQVVEPAGLAWLIHRNVLWLTTPDAAQNIIQTRLYRVRNDARLDDVLRAVTQNVNPSHWADAGGPGATAGLELPGGRRGLLVSASFQTHRQIERHFAEQIKPVTGTPVPLAETVASPSIAQGLQSPIAVDYIEHPLKDVLACLNAQTKVPITINPRAGTGSEDPGDTHVTLCVRGIPLESALSILVHDMPLTWKLVKDRVEVGRPEKTPDHLVHGTYKVEGLALRGRLDHVVHSLERTVEPRGWDPIGGPGVLRGGADGMLVVRHTYAVHRTIAGLLGDMLEATK